MKAELSHNATVKEVHYCNLIKTEAYLNMSRGFYILFLYADCFHTGFRKYCVTTKRAKKFKDVEEMISFYTERAVRKALDIPFVDPKQYIIEFN